MKFATDMTKGILGAPDSTVLWTDIISQIPDAVLLKPGVRILNVAAGHGTEALILAKRMLALGVSKEQVNESIYLIDKYRVFTNYLTKIGFKNVITADFLKWETDMKFDVVVGNPPFSLAGNKTSKRGRAKNLYDKFYRLATELADYVYMIMPDTSKQISDHNNILAKTANSIVKIQDDVFPTIGISVWYVIKDGSSSKPNIKWKNKILPRQYVNWAKGKLNVTVDKDALKDTDNPTLTVIHKLTSKGLLTYRTNYKVSPKVLFPIGGYAVILPQQIQDTGWAATEIIKCDSRIAAMNGVNIAFMPTKKEAERLVEFMKSDEFITQALNNMGGMNNMILRSLQMIDMSSFWEKRDKNR